VAGWSVARRAAGKTRQAMFGQGPGRHRAEQACHSALSRQGMHSMHSAAGSLFLVVDAQAAADVQELEVKALRGEGTQRQAGTVRGTVPVLQSCSAQRTCLRVCWTA